MSTVAVQSEAILKELGQLWRTLGKQDEKGNAVVRACAMTLLVITAEQEDAQELSETLAHLVNEHPSRAIVLRLRDTPEPLLEARVFAQCWMPFGRRQQICSEQVEITAGSGSLADVPTAILGLTVPDLPVVYWCRDVRLLSDPELSRLLPLADKIIIDTGRVERAAETVHDIVALRQRVRTVADLSWTRLTPWRQTISRAFDSPSCLAQARAVHSVTIATPHKPFPVAAAYLGAWFQHTLGPQVKVRLEQGEKSLVRIEAPETMVTIARTSGDTVEVQSNQSRFHTVFPAQSDTDLLRQELAILGRDPIFEGVLPFAERLLDGALTTA